MAARAHSAKKRTFHSSASALKPSSETSAIVPPPPPAEVLPPAEAPVQTAPESTLPPAVEPPPISPPPSPPFSTPAPADTSSSSQQIHQLASLFTTPSSPPPAPTPVPSFFPRLPVSDAPHHKLVWLVLILALLTGAGVAGLAIYHFTSSRENPSSPLSAPTPLPKPSATSPTPTPTPLRRDLKLQVLNGSGTPGGAGIAADYLEGLGYQNIATGNANSYTYNQTEIAILDAKKAYLELLISDLSTKYSVSSASSNLDSASPYDAVIVIGQK